MNWLAMAAGWLSVQPSDGVVPAGGSQVLDVTFDASRYCGGDYLADLMIDLAGDEAGEQGRRF